MKNLDRYQKIIWENSCKVKLPDPPKLQESWYNLRDSLNLGKKSDLKSKNIFLTLYAFLKNILSKEKHNYKVLTSFSLTLTLITYFSIQVYSNLNFITHETPQRLIRLPDGSSITLNKSSSIKYKHDFIEHRQLNLNGEAFFNVRKGEIPFIITTDFGEVKVLGTSFNVRSREDGFEVGVNEGIVEVSNNRTSLLIKKDEMIKLSLDPFTEGQSISEVYNDYPDWINNKLYFENTPILEVCREIERTFNITVNFSKSILNNIKVTGIIETTDIKSVLSSLSLLTKCDFKLEGDICTVI